MGRAAVALWLLVACACAARGSDRGDRPAPIILISFDGFRWDYETKAPAPNMRSLAARGIRAENLIPSFPSKTFPNHYTIVTGLYPGHHGIVANNIHDSATGRTFGLSNRREVGDPMWWGGEPIWVTAQRQGLTAGAVFWPGSEAPIDGMYPRYWKPFDDSYPPDDRVDQALQWLELPPGERPHFITLYFSDVDSAGHSFGPDSTEVQEAVRRVDGYLGRLLKGLEARGLTSAVNVVVVSDHGMAAVDSSRVVVVDDYVSAADVDVVDINPTLGLFTKDGKADEVYAALEKAHPRLRVYRRESTPEQWHYRDHPRIPPIVGVADEGWQVVRRATVDAFRAGKIAGDRGNHGYDPNLMSMRGIFIAAGPAFRAGATIDAFQNIHIYNALAAALRVAPGGNDGDMAIARSLLR